MKPLREKRPAHERYRIGLDVGGVIIDRDNDASDTSMFSHNYLGASPMDACLETIAALPGEIYVVSKCGPVVQAKTLAWLGHHGFYSRARIPLELCPERVLFCRDRAQKAVIAKRLGLRAFVDDRLDVLLPMRDIVPLCILFGPPGETAVFKHIANACTWAEVRALIDADYASFVRHGR